jgi:GH15 family glucan-1,4-alpha-glucosidase
VAGGSSFHEQSDAVAKIALESDGIQMLLEDYGLIGSMQAAALVGRDPKRRSFTQYYGSKELDASVLNTPLVGFLPGTDERVTGTITP